VKVEARSAIFEDIYEQADSEGNSLLDVWMSHGDKVTKMPAGFSILASTPSRPIAGIVHESRRFSGVQFHPEVTHTLQCKRIYEHFILNICGCEPLWTPANIVEDAIKKVRAQGGTDKVLLGLSGGVDSSVVAALLHKAIGDQLTCLFV